MSLANGLTLLIAYRDGRDDLEKLLCSLPAGESSTGFASGLEVLVIDDCSTLAPIAHSGVRVYRMPSRGYFAGAVNAGMAQCRGDALVLNQDVWFENSDWLELVAKWQEEDDLAIAGDGVLNHPAWPGGYVQGTFMYLRRKAWEDVGEFDAKWWPLWGCTAEWQVRAVRKGWRADPRPVPGMRHKRDGRFGAAITRTLQEEGEKRSTFIRTPPLISIVVPVYNYGRYIPDLMASLLGGDTSLGRMQGQTFQGFEVILVDDASTDDSLQIVERYENPGAGVHILRLEHNLGTAGAINAGVRASYGQYIQVVCADDMLEPMFLERMLEESEAHPHSLVYCDSTTFAHGRRLSAWRLSDYDFDNLLERNQIPVYAMYPRQAWEEAGGYPELFKDGREDWAFAVAAGMKGYCGVHFKEALYLYRREGQNRSLRNANARERFLIQMRRTFPGLYAGERPMGCCGGRSRSRVTGGTAKEKAMRIGEEGMELLIYEGNNFGMATVTGAVTHQVYRFSASKRLFYADKRDVEALLALPLRDGGRLTRYITPPPEKVEEEKKMEAVTQEPVEMEQAEESIAMEEVDAPAEVQAEAMMTVANGPSARRGRPRKKQDPESEKGTE